MKYFKRAAYLISTMIFSAMSLLAYAPAASANSYPGGNWKLTFYSPVTDTDTAQEIYTVNADGTNLQRITDDSIQQANPQWSPSMTSRMIAFDQDDDVADPAQNRNIYTQAIDAIGAKSGSPAVVSGANTCENEWDPSWSPDEATVAYHRTSIVRADCSVGSPGGPNHIFTIPSAGGSATARTGGGGTDADFRDTEPTWNKDGDTLTFTRTDTSDDSTDIATVPSTGSEAGVIIIPGSDGGGSPQWSPDENTIVFTKGGEVWTYASGAGSATQLTTGATIASAPTYSPDGKIIATSGTAGIAFYNSTTGALLDTVTIADNAPLGFTASNGIHEVDWARTSTPPSTVHECTTFVNNDCTDDEFDPSIPDACSTGNLSAITKAAAYGDPSYSGGKFTYSPDNNYVGTDQYIYTYYDSNLNAITCTVNITVLPLTPDAGAPTGSNRGMLVGSIMAAGALSAGYVYKKKRFARR
jgi:hypothetical protein